MCRRCAELVAYTNGEKKPFIISFNFTLLKIFSNIKNQHRKAWLWEKKRINTHQPATAAVNIFVLQVMNHFSINKRKWMVPVWLYFSLFCQFYP